MIEGSSPRTHFIHPTAEVGNAVIGTGTRIWNEAQVMDGARIGRGCILGKGVFVDADVEVGDRVKLENRVSLFRGARVASGAFIGPHSCLLNDRNPRSILPTGELKTVADWTVTGVTVEYGASIGGNCTVLPGVRIGRFAMVGAGAVVTRNVAPHALAVGNPARRIGSVCECGGRLTATGNCPLCSRTYDYLGQDQ